MIRAILRSIIVLTFRVTIYVTYKAYGIEGINALFLVMPSKLIAPTLRRFGAEIGEETQIHSPLIIHNATDDRNHHYSNLSIADNCYVGRDVLFDLKAPIHLDEYVTVSMRCTLITHTDAGDRPENLTILSASKGEIWLQRGVYLGASVTVLESTTIGELSIVGAGALVNRDVPARAIVVGVPARPVRNSSTGDRAE